MTALAAEIMAILKGNDGLRADSLVSVLNAIGYAEDRIPLDQIEVLAEMPEVIFIRPADEPMMN